MPGICLHEPEGSVNRLRVRLHLCWFTWWAPDNREDQMCESVQPEVNLNGLGCIVADDYDWSAAVPASPKELGGARGLWRIWAGSRLNAGQGALYVLNNGWFTERARVAQDSKRVLLSSDGLGRLNVVVPQPGAQLVCGAHIEIPWIDLADGPVEVEEYGPRFGENASQVGVGPWGHERGTWAMVDHTLSNHRVASATYWLSTESGSPSAAWWNRTASLPMGSKAGISSPLTLTVRCWTG